MTVNIFKTRYPKQGDEMIYDTGGISKAIVTIK